MKTRSILTAALLPIGLLSQAIAAVDLVTIPRREGAQLTIYNSEDITMVREHRLLTVKEGVNRIQFSWAETLIDPTSIDFRILDHQDQVDLIDTTFPTGRNDALQWNIRSRIAGRVPVEIRYFTSGITWKADYVGIANQDETKLQLTGYVRVFNNSGELYDNAQTRMVVGSINLVEKIATLAKLPASTVELFDGQKSSRLRLGLEVDRLAQTYEYAGRQGGIGGGGMLVDAKPAEQAKDVKKQGLSEYFLFTIEGQEDIKNGEPKRLISMRVADVPLECIYKLSDRDGAQQFTKF
ncbi:MAG TPA: hypothetical protein VE890_01915, partial [Thermoguttaceae bacterium]|nr:hypothetical protein [Thermoguttaceae bacterium]